MVHFLIFITNDHFTASDHSLTSARRLSFGLINFSIRLIICMCCHSCLMKSMMLHKLIYPHTIVTIKLVTSLDICFSPWSGFISSQISFPKTHHGDCFQLIEIAKVGVLFCHHVAYVFHQYLLFINIVDHTCLPVLVCVRLVVA